MNTIERFGKLTPNKQSLLTVWLDQHKNGSNGKDAADADKQLVAYVVLKNGTRDTATLREYLRGQTPEYMVPDAFVPLDSLPLTTNGKIDRQRLSEPPKTSSIDDNFVAPRTQLEEEAGGPMERGLEKSSVLVSTTTSSISGGHSLLATRLMFQLREHFNVDIPLRALFEARRSQRSHP